MSEARAKLHGTSRDKPLIIPRREGVQRMLKWDDSDNRLTSASSARLIFWLAAAFYILALVLVAAGWTQWFSFLMDKGQTLLTLVQ